MNPGEGVAVDPANGHIFIADSSAGKVYDFSSPSDTSPTVIDGSTTPSGPFPSERDNLSLAVDNTTGDLYVFDASHALLDKFDRNGNLITSFGDATPTPDGQLTGAATPAHSFRPYQGAFNGGESAPIAVDQQTGELYVLDQGAEDEADQPGEVTKHQVVDAFDQNGAYLRQLTASPHELYSIATHLTSIAVDAASGHLFLFDPFHQQTAGKGGATYPPELYDFDAFSLEFLDTWNGAESPLGPSSRTPQGKLGVTANVATDDSGHLFVAVGSNNEGEEPFRDLDVFDTSGAYLFQVPLPIPPTNTSERNSAGLAVDEATGDLYVTTHNANSVEVYAPTVPGPRIAPQPASPPTRTAATVHAAVQPNPGEEITFCAFEYGTTQAFGQTESCAPSPPYTSAKEVDANLTGLSAGTTYFYRLSLTNSAAHTRTGPIRSLQTLPAVTELQTTAPATAITQQSATLHGSFTGEETLATEYFFEYGTSANYGQKTSTATVPAPASATQPEHRRSPESKQNSSPAPPTTTASSPKTNSAPPSAKTRPSPPTRPPTIEGFSSSDLTATSADLHATINPQGFPTPPAASNTAPPPPTARPPPARTARRHLGSASASVEVHIPASSAASPTTSASSPHNALGGTATSEDQSFEFFPPACPNSAVRQQTGSAYLPDCRAYELVSPANANGTLLFPGGPNTGQATSPSRFSFVGDFSALPGAEHHRHRRRPLRRHPHRHRLGLPLHRPPRQPGRLHRRPAQPTLRLQPGTRPDQDPEHASSPTPR